ncbi:ABC transporter ATP-binding protein [Natrarchaeobius chitinivorans]|uniref:ABC transporter ATP-binding protein n=1 Tax=Natrarchaeobius chitinivorans TaxID=1679083 RepID=A0A3N6LRG4_NATCH|nr:ABC transporter ATP-binding protein [Natrarchaeobius chitinivorans]RQG89714.1 ABC transporter ATP-binding protein [Natrarchaeobius chitinivorans]
MLRVEDIDVSYGDIQVVWDVSLEIGEDEDIVAIIGPNGGGKSTTLNAISGIKSIDDGRVTIMGEDATSLKKHEIVDLGFVQVPEERNLFPAMTVLENLEMGAFPKRARDKQEETLREVFELFPVLEEKQDQQAQNLSGGQQQMVAIGRGLMARPKILALDEPSSGLAPKIVDRVFETIDQISSDTKILLIEQHVDLALNLAERAYLLEGGRMVTSGSGDELADSEHVKKAYLQD